jgi:hypothetical protein
MGKDNERDQQSQCQINVKELAGISLNVDPLFLPVATMRTINDASAA